MASGETNLYRYAGGDPANFVDPTGLFKLSDISDAFAGFGDTASFGVTQRIRGALGIDCVDYCSSAYGYGGNAATGVELATGVAGAAKLIGKVGLRQIGRRLADETGSIQIGPSGRRSLPARGKPNSTDAIDRGNGRGQIRDYDSDGRALKDFDFGHNHGAGDPHAHDWVDGVRQGGRPIRAGE